MPLMTNQVKLVNQLFSLCVHSNSKTGYRFSKLFFKTLNKMHSHNAFF